MCGNLYIWFLFPSFFSVLVFFFRHDSNGTRSIHVCNTYYGYTIYIPLLLHYCCGPAPCISIPLPQKIDRWHLPLVWVVVLGVNHQIKPRIPVDFGQIELDRTCALPINSYSNHRRNNPVHWQLVLEWPATPWRDCLRNTNVSCPHQSGCTIAYSGMTRLFAPVTRLIINSGSIRYLHHTVLLVTFVWFYATNCFVDFEIEEKYCFTSMGFKWNPVYKLEARHFRLLSSLCCVLLNLSCVPSPRRRDFRKPRFNEPAIKPK